jgi:hypothetical protein
MSEPNLPPGDGVVGVMRVWADAEVTHGPNWVDPEETKEK